MCRLLAGTERLSLQSGPLAPGKPHFPPRPVIDIEEDLILLFLRKPIQENAGRRPESTSSLLSIGLSSLHHSRAFSSILHARAGPLWQRQAPLKHAHPAATREDTR